MTATTQARHFDPVAHRSLRSCVRLFLTHPSPFVIGAFCAGALAARIAVGGWTWLDLVVAAAIVAFQPFSEWLIHTYVLHFKPFAIGGRRIDLHLAKQHRRHHRDPKNIDVVFVPIRALLIGIPLGVLLVWLAFDFSPISLTVMLTIAAILFVYEWTHFIVHTPYRPQSWYGRYVARAHRLHHYRNEHYWMGVTVHLADHVLGTFPERSDVPLSDTARSLA